MPAVTLVFTRGGSVASALLVLVACGAEPAASAAIESVSISPEDLGARPACELGCACEVEVDQPAPSPPCASDAPLFSNEDPWRSPEALPRGAHGWVDRSRLRRIPVEHMEEAIELLEDRSVVRLASPRSTGPQPYLLRAVFPDFPGAPGCRHSYAVRLEGDGVLTVINATLSRVGQCPVAMRRSAIVADLDASPTLVRAQVSTLVQ
jgi:hypothetical protein